MLPNAKTSLVPLCSIVTGIGLLAAGCGDNLAPDRLDDVSLPCPDEQMTFKLDRADVSAVVAQEIDLDGNDRPDNALGRAHDLVAALAPGFNTTDRFRGRLATDVAWTITLDRCKEDVRVTIAPTDTGLPHYPRAAGIVSPDGVLFAEDGTGQVPLLALADATGTNTNAGWRTGDALTIRAKLDGDTLSGVFAMALPTATVKADLAAPIAEFLTTEPADNAMRIVADANKDDVVTAEEVAATTTYGGMTQSDLSLVIDGEPQTSIAFRFHATARR